VRILDELEDSFGARADVINSILPKEGHGISVLISASLIQMLSSLAVLKPEYIYKLWVFFFYFQNCLHGISKCID